MSVNLVESAINHGTLRSIPTIRKFNFANRRSILCDNLQNGSISKTTGWEYRLVANYAHILADLKNHNLFPSDYFYTEKYEIQCRLTGKTVFGFECKDIIDTIFKAAVDAKNLHFVSEQKEITGLEALRHICLNVYSDYRLSSSVDNSMCQLFNLIPSEEKYNSMLDIWLDQYHNLDPSKLTPEEVVQLIERVRVIYGQEPYFSAKLSSIKKLFSEVNLNQEQLTDIMNTMPRIYTIPLGLTVEQYLQLSPQAMTISRLPHSIAAYTLGFPIQNGIPGDAQITAALLKLSRDGPQEYMVSVGGKWDPFIRYECEGLIWSTNEEDAITMIPYRHFGPFDRIAYIEDDHAFEFTRSSWNSLLEETAEAPQVNPFTRKPLSKAFLEELKARIAIAELYELPESDTLDSLIENAKKYGAKRESSVMMPALISAGAAAGGSQNVLLASMLELMAHPSGGMVSHHSGGGIPQFSFMSFGNS